MSYRYKTKLNLIFSVTYYLMLHNVLSFTIDVNFLTNKDVNFLQCPSNQFNLC